MDEFEKQFRIKHTHGDIVNHDKKGFIFISCSLCSGCIRLPKCDNVTDSI